MNNKKRTDLEKIFEEKLREELLSKKSLKEVYKLLSIYKERGLIDSKEFDKLFNQYKALHQEKRENKEHKLLVYGILATVFASIVTGLVGYKEELLIFLNKLLNWFGQDFVDVVKKSIGM